MLNPFLGSWNNEALAGLRAPKPYVVVLDPGHGGNDHGASAVLGKKRITEKEIALGIAIRTARALRGEEYAGILDRPVQVLLTREKDIYVGLEQRAEIARKAGADLFVSIHSNSDPSKKGEGLEIYFLNNTDQTSDSKLEQIENRLTERYKGPGKQASLLLRSVAADAVVDSSREAAGTLQASLGDHLRGKGISFQDRGVRQGLLYVLLDSQVPAVLLEAFFMSHPGDLKLLNEPDSRQMIADGLARGILRYLALH
jgi:N-acetylmuramoyl-L-alanine amidase